MSSPELQLSEQQIKDLKAAFEFYDVDKDGSIDAKELAPIAKAIGFSLTDQELQDIIAEADADGNSTIEFTEFCDVLYKKYKETASAEKILIEAFKQMDKDGNGSIDENQFKQLIGSLSKGLSEEEMDDMVKEASQKKDGKIYYEEFVKNMLQQVTKK